MDWLMFWFWVGVVLILAASLIPNEKCNWVILLIDAFSKIGEKREAKKFPEFAARWKEYNAKEDELEKFYNEKIISVVRSIRITTRVLHQATDENQKEIFEKVLKVYQDDLNEYKTFFEERRKELDVEFVELTKEKVKLGIKHLI